MKINFEVDIFGWSKTQCPNANFLLRVGSKVCQECRYNKKQNNIEHYVDCDCPYGEKFTTIQNKLH